MKRCFFCDLFCLLYLGFLGCCTILSKIVYFLSTVDLEERSIRSMEDNPSLFVLVFIEGKKGIVVFEAMELSDLEFEDLF